MKKEGQSAESCSYIGGPVGIWLEPAGSAGPERWW